VGSRLRRVTLRDCDFGAVLRGLAAFASPRLAAAFFATFVDLMDVLLAIAFTRRCLRYATLIEVILALGDARICLLLPVPSI
jgi:hypothetical protein